MSSDFSQGTSPAIVRINELARELGVKAKTIIDLLPGYGVAEKKTHSSSIPADVAEKVRKNILDQTQAKVSAVPAKRILAGPPTAPSSSGSSSVVLACRRNLRFIGDLLISITY
jgi:hypothetical protein